MNFFKKKTKKEKLKLIPAAKAYEEAAEPQWENYLREIKTSKEQGREHCCLSSSIELLREEHKKKLLEAGYDLSISIHKDMILKGRKVFVECFWDENASGKIREYKNDFEPELPI